MKFVTHRPLILLLLLTLKVLAGVHLIPEYNKPQHIFLPMDLYVPQRPAYETLSFFALAHAPVTFVINMDTNTCLHEKKSNGQTQVEFYKSTINSKEFYSKYYREYPSLRAPRYDFLCSHYKKDALVNAFVQDFSLLTGLDDQSLMREYFSYINPNTKTLIKPKNVEKVRHIPLRLLPSLLLSDGRGFLYTTEILLSLNKPFDPSTLEFIKQKNISFQNEKVAIEKVLNHFFIFKKLIWLQASPLEHTEHVDTVVRFVKDKNKEVHVFLAMDYPLNKDLSYHLDFSETYNDLSKDRRKRFASLITQKEKSKELFDQRTQAIVNNAKNYQTLKKIAGFKESNIEFLQSGPPIEIKPSSQSSWFVPNYVNALTLNNHALIPSYDDGLIKNDNQIKNTLPKLFKTLDDKALRVYQKYFKVVKQNKANNQTLNGGPHCMSFVHYGAKE